MISIGIAGGIGCGKSFAMERFARCTKLFFFHLFDCDSEARQIMLSNDQVRRELTQLLGPETYADNGMLNKEHVAERLFKNPDCRKEINAIVHPRVIERLEQVKAELSNDVNGKFNVLLVESALFYTAHLDRCVDKVVWVWAPFEIRVNRVMERNHIAQEQVIERILAQREETKHIAEASLVVVNDGRSMFDAKLRSFLYGVYREMSKLTSSAEEMEAK